MPDSKITALASIGTGTDPAVDPLVIVDVSDTTMAASGTTKKVTLNNLLACSPTATLASATITGNLTVDTNTFFVDSANNRVIVGHTSGSSAFQVTNAGAAGFEVQPTGVNSAPAILSYNRSSPAWLQLTYGASSHVFQLSGTDAMTLNSTGLGVGQSVIGAKVDARDTSSVIGFRYIESTTGNNNRVQLGAGAGFGYIDATASAGSPALQLRTAGNTAATIDSSGNVISNVTGTAPTLATNSQMVFNLTSNTNLRISVRGTDGTTRTANITLA